MTERQRLNITEFYNETITGDISQAIDTYKTEAALFPNSSVAFVNMAADYSTIGKPELAIAPAARGVQLAPTSASYNTLVAVQIQAGRPADAQQTAELALRRGIDNDDMHHGLLHSHYAQNQPDGVDSQLAWGRRHADAVKVHLDGVLLALIQGQRRRAHDMLEEYHAGDPSSAFVGESEAVVADAARFLSEVGLAGESNALLKEFAANSEEKSALVALSQSGAASRMDSTLRQLETDHGEEYVWKYDTLPEIRAALLLSRHQPQAALTALEPARQFDAVSFGPGYLRGRAYLDLGRPALAGAEFKKITSRIYADTLSPLYPLAGLQLARCYSADNDPGKSRAEYERFLASWSNSDPDIPVYIAAKAEYAKLLAMPMPSNAPLSPHAPEQLR
jgi:tetratricopeptide (TPR) repeat protein